MDPHLLKGKLEGILGRLNSLKEDGVDHLLIIGDLETGLAMIECGLLNPMAIKSFIAEFLKNTDLDNSEDIGLRQAIAFIIVNAVLEYLDANKAKEVSNKYKQFLAGDITGLTDDEVNQFIDMTKLNPVDNPILTKELKEDYDKIIFPLLCDYNINKLLGNALYEHFWTYLTYFKDKSLRAKNDLNVRIKKESEDLVELYNRPWLSEFTSDIIKQLECILDKEYTKVESK